MFSNIGFVCLMQGSQRKPELGWERLYLESSIASADAAEKAEHWFGRALIVDQSSISANYGAGLATLSSGKYEQSVTYWGLAFAERPLISGPWLAEASYRMGLMQEGPRLSRNFPQLVPTLRKQAGRLVSLSEYVAAAKFYDLVSYLSPDLVSNWLDLMEIYANDWDKVEQAYEQAVTYLPDDPYILMAGARLQFYGRGNLPLALDLANRAWPKLQGMALARDADSRCRLCDVYILMGDLAVPQARDDLAELYWCKVLDFRGGKGRDIMTRIAHLFQRRGNSVEAQAWMDRALAETPAYEAQPYISQGDLFMAQGNLLGAVQAYQEAVNRQPTITVYRFILADALLKAGYRDHAIAEYQQILASDPGNFHARDALSKLTNNRWR